MKFNINTIISWFLLLLLIAGAANAQEIQLGLNIIPNPSNHLSDWQSDPNAVTVSVMNLTTQNLAARIGATLDKDGSHIADIKDNAKPNVSLHPGMNIFRGADILPVNGMEYFGSSGSDAQRTGILPEGDYRLCVNINVIIPGNSPSAPPHTANAEECKSFIIAVATPPILITPADGSTVKGPIINFSWLPPMPQSSQPMKYDLKIVEILGNQSPEDALRSNPPIVQKQTSATSEQIPIEMTQLSLTGSNPTTSSLNGNHKFAWGVSTHNPGGSSSSSTPSTFSQKPEQLGLTVDTNCIECTKEFISMSAALDTTCRLCDSLRRAMQALNTAIAVAKQPLAAAAGNLNAAKAAVAAAKANVATANTANKTARSKLNAAAAAAGVTVVPYPNGFKSILQFGYSTVGGNSAASGVAVQGSAGALMNASSAYPNFWAIFNSANTTFNTFQQAMAAYRNAIANFNTAQSKVEDVQKMLDSLRADSSALAAKINACGEDSARIAGNRESLEHLRDTCLHHLQEKQTAIEKIREAESAVKGANGATSSADHAINAAGSSIEDRPNASNLHGPLSKAANQNQAAKGNASAAQQGIDNARKALASGNPNQAAVLADTARAKANLAVSQATIADTMATAIGITSNQYKTRQQLIIDSAIDTRKKQQDDSITYYHQRQYWAQLLINAGIANGLTNWGIPNSVGGCLVNDSLAFKNFLKWMQQNHPSNIDLNVISKLYDITRSMGEVSASILEAFAKGESFMQGLMSGLAQAGFGLEAGFIYDWMKDQASAATKQLIDKHVIQIIAAQATRSHGVINGVGFNGKNTSSIFYFKDCNGEIQVFRISATFGFEYIGAYHGS